MKGPSRDFLSACHSLEPAFQSPGEESRRVLQGRLELKAQGAWAGTAVAELLCTACSQAGHSLGLRLFSSHQFLGLLVRSTVRRHC